MSDQTDFYAWTHEQAARLREAAAAGTNLPIDWEAVAEELEDMGRSERSALESRISTIIEHLLKLQHSPAQDPRRGWHETVLRSRRDIARLIKRNPSLRQEIPEIVEDEMSSTAQLVIDILAEYGEADQAITAAILGTRYSAEQITDDWFPDA